MASVQAVQQRVQLLSNYLKKRNIIEMMLMNAVQQLYNLVTYWSRRKLLKYNLLLAQEKLGKLEGALGSSSPYATQGQSINRLR